MDYKRFKALKNAIEPSQKQLEPFREELADALKAYTGPHYGKQATDDRPINMLQLSVESLLQQLSSRAPQALCFTPRPELQSSAIELELALNLALKKMKFEQEHRLWVLSAIFLVGIMEVGLDIIASPEIDGEDLPITEVFCEAIMFDDFVFDTTATKWNRRQVSFWGHKYRMSLEEAKKDKRFDKEARKQLKAIEKPDSKDGMSKISKPNGNDNAEPFTEMCEIWQIFVPEENEVITFSVDGGDKPLKTVQWKGPKHGPYHMVGFNPVLNNIIPLAPVANWIALDDLENKLYTKLGEQASRQKTIGITDLQGVTDGQTIIKTSDGDVIAVGNPNAFKEASFGGVNQQTLGFALNVKSMADFVMGNLSAQMGLGASANTLGQEQMIKQASNIRIASMQGVLLSATEAILEDVAFYLHHHPTQEFDLTREIPGTDIKLPIKWPRRDNGFGDEVDVRIGEYEEYAISIEPYSMQEISPGQRAQLLQAIWRQDILPAIQLGVQPDVYKYLDKLAKYYDLPELRELVPMIQESMDPLERSTGRGAPQPGKPNGQYTRENVSRGMTPQAADQQREMMAMAGGGGEEQGT
jgi:hypothetical protein